MENELLWPWILAAVLATLLLIIAAHSVWEWQRNVKADGRRPLAVLGKGLGLTIGTMLIVVLVIAATMGLFVHLGFGLGLLVLGLLFIVMTSKEGGY